MIDKHCALNAPAAISFTSSPPSDYSHNNMTMGSMQEHAGHRPRVRSLAAYKDFLALWKDADPDIPILKQAKAEYAKRVLSSTSSRRVKVPLAPK
jgi:hypothetical protein